MPLRSRLRLVLVLFLSVALDFSTPVRSEAMHAMEEVEEVAHRDQARRLLRANRDTTPATPAVRRITVPRVRPPAPALRRVRTTEVRARKIPPLIAEPSSAPEDH